MITSRKRTTVTYICGFLSGLFLAWMLAQNNFTFYIPDTCQNCLDKMEQVSKDESVDLTNITLSNHYNGPLYGETDNASIASRLAEKVPVVCFILTSPSNHLKRAVHVKFTWGRRCNRLYFMSTSYEPLLESIALNVTEGYWFLWDKTIAAIRYLSTYAEPEEQWFYKADDDTYAVMENLRYTLLHFNTSEAIAIGNLFRPGDNLTDQHLNGGAGYVLSRAALKLLATEGHRCFPDVHKGYEDIMLSRCLRQLGGRLVSALDHDNRERFFQNLPQLYLSPAGQVGTSCEVNIGLSYHAPEKGFNCCSTTAVAFHHVPPRHMYMMDYLIYFLKPFGMTRTFQLDNH